MNKFSANYEQIEGRYYLDSGRWICKDGKQLFSIHLHSSNIGIRYNFEPCRGDAIAHFIVEELNKGKFEKYFIEYMKH